MPIACFKAGSDEIIGANMLFVLAKDDDFNEKIYKQVNVSIRIVVMGIKCAIFFFQFKSQITKTIFDLEFICYQDFDVFKFYGVDKILTSFGLSVNRKYRGRSIGDHLLATRFNSFTICNYCSKHSK